MLWWEKNEVEDPRVFQSPNEKEEEAENQFKVRFGHLGVVFIFFKCQEIWDLSSVSLSKDL